MASLKSIISLLVGLGLGSFLTYYSKKPKKSQKTIPKSQFERNSQFFLEGQKKIENSFVVVIGLGGVGSHCVVGLARSGIKRLRLIDFDIVTVGSLNRHAVAVTDDVGQTKADVIKRHINEIAPNCEVEAINTLFSKENAPDLLNENPDFVIDCIDNINTKADLLEFCYKNELKVISSGGAGGKIDPSRMEISDISSTKNCELIRKLRKILHRRGVREGIPIVYSAEGASQGLLRVQDKKSDTQEKFDQIANFRTRVMPVIGTMPAVTGNSIATYVLAKLGGIEFKSVDKENVRRNTFNKFYQGLEILEKNRFKNKLDMNFEEFENVCGDIWHWQSVISHTTIGIDAVRFDITKPPSENNLIMLTKQEMRKHLDGTLGWSEAQIQEINRKLNN